MSTNSLRRRRRVAFVAVLLLGSCVLATGSPQIAWGGETRGEFFAPLLLGRDGKPTRQQPLLAQYALPSFRLAPNEVCQAFVQGGGEGWSGRKGIGFAKFVPDRPKVGQTLIRLYKWRHSHFYQSPADPGTGTIEVLLRPGTRYLYRIVVMPLPSDEAFSLLNVEWSIKGPSTGVIQRLALLKKPIFASGVLRVTVTSLWSNRGDQRPIQAEVCLKFERDNRPFEDPIEWVDSKKYNVIVLDNVVIAQDLRSSAIWAHRGQWFLSLLVRTPLPIANEGGRWRVIVSHDLTDLP